MMIYRWFIGLCLVVLLAGCDDGIKALPILSSSSDTGIASGVGGSCDPAMVAGFQIVGSTSQGLQLTWDGHAAARSYDLFWALDRNITAGTRVANVAPGQVLTGLPANTPLFIALRAYGPQGCFQTAELTGIFSMPTTFQLDQHIVAVGSIQRRSQSIASPGQIPEPLIFIPPTFEPLPVFGIPDGYDDFKGEDLGFDSFSHGGAGAVRIAPEAYIDIAIPAGVDLSPSRGPLLELQFDCLGNGNLAAGGDYCEIDFTLTADNDPFSVLAGNGYIDNDNESASATTTVHVDLGALDNDTTYLRLQNQSGHDWLFVNNTFALLPIEQPGNGVYVVDLRQGSSRIIDTVQHDTTVSFNRSGELDYPDDLLRGGDLFFDISDLLAGMSEPVAEFHWQREYDEDDDTYLYDSQGNQIFYFAGDYESDEDLGQSMTVSLLPYKNSPFFRLDVDWDSYMNPFIKLYDAADRTGSTLLLDVTPTGHDFVADSGNFHFYQRYADYPNEGNLGFGNALSSLYHDDVEYDAPHWVADPTMAPYGTGGELEFSLPESVAAMAQPVLEIVHFVPDSETWINGSVANDPDYFPVEFFLKTGADNNIAHVFFGEYEDDQGCTRINQIPLGEFKNAPTLKIVVPADNQRWSQVSFPPFFKIYDVGPANPDHIEPPPTDG